MVDHKDIIIAVFGASFGIAGLLLVFAGFLFSLYATLPIGTTTKETRATYRFAFKLIAATLVVDVLLVSSSLSWLLTQEAFWLTIALFSLTLVALPALAIRVGYIVLRG